MKIQFLNAPEFTIDSNGKLYRSGSWLLTDTDHEFDDISTPAFEWAGSVGDPWRIPNAAGDSFKADNDLHVSKIMCKSLDSTSCIVTFEATTGDIDNESISTVEDSYRFERRKDLTEYKFIEYTLTDSTIDALPAVGELISWAGNEYCCESVHCQVINDTTLKATLCAVNTAITPAGRTDSFFDKDHIEIKTASWLVSNSQLDDFLAGNVLHSAAAWAGENFYISEIKTAPAESPLYTTVTIQARCSTLKLLEVLRKEEIVSTANINAPEKLYIWNSLWRATADDREQFENMLGNSAEEWTGDSQSIVSKVTPRRISDCEYEYVLEACYPEAVTTGGSSRYWRDRDLPDRLEYYTRVGEMRFSPRQCGYRYRYNGHYIALKSWQPLQLCPLNTSDPLPLNWVNQPVKLLEIVEVSFLSGTSAENLDSITPWFTESRISSTAIAGVSGSFLRYDLDVDDVTDHRGRSWTRITKVYRQAPGSYTWNSNYWI